MVSNDMLLDAFAGLIDDLGYKITYNDIDGQTSNVMGIYLREAGNPIGTLGDTNRIHRVDMTIRLHGDTTAGSQEKCERDLITITERLTMSNCKLANINILGSSLRGRGSFLSKTTKGIPVYNISFLITFN